MSTPVTTGQTATSRLFNKPQGDTLSRAQTAAVQGRSRRRMPTPEEVRARGAATSQARKDMQKRDAPGWGRFAWDTLKGTAGEGLTRAQQLGQSGFGAASAVAGGATGALGKGIEAVAPEGSGLSHVGQGLSESGLTMAEAGARDANNLFYGMAEGLQGKKDTGQKFEMGARGEGFGERMRHRVAGDENASLGNAAATATEWAPTIGEAATGAAATGGLASGTAGRLGLAAPRLAGGARTAAQSAQATREGAKGLTRLATGPSKATRAARALGDKPGLVTKALELPGQAVRGVARAGETGVGKATRYAAPVLGLEGAVAGYDAMEGEPSAGPGQPQGTPQISSGGEVETVAPGQQALAKAPAIDASEATVSGRQEYLQNLPPEQQQAFQAEFQQEVDALVNPTDGSRPMSERHAGQIASQTMAQRLDDRMTGGAGAAQPAAPVEPITAGGPGPDQNANIPGAFPAEPGGAPGAVPGEAPPADPATAALRNAGHNPQPGENPIPTADVVAAAGMPEADVEATKQDSETKVTENNKKIPGEAENALKTGKVDPTSPLGKNGVTKLQQDTGWGVDDALQAWDGMSTEHKVMAGLGLGIGAIGLISAISGKGGAMGWLLGLLGLGAAAGLGASGGMFGQGAQDFTQGAMGQLTGAFNDMLGGEQGPPGFGEQGGGVGPAEPAGGAAMPASDQLGVLPPPDAAEQALSAGQSGTGPAVAGAKAPITAESVTGFMSDGVLDAGELGQVNTAAGRSAVMGMPSADAKNVMQAAMTSDPEFKSKVELVAYRAGGMYNQNVQDVLTQPEGTMVKMPWGKPPVAALGMSPEEAQKFVAYAKELSG